MKTRTSSPKPLYIDGSKGCLVTLDGPALKLEVESRAPVRIPLRRLSRVVSDYRVQWTPKALYHCIEEGIPISICSANGKAVGIVLPLDNRRTSFAEEIRIFRTHPDWIGRYEIWRFAAERRAILNANKAGRLRLKNLNPPRVSKALSNRLEKVSDEDELKAIADQTHGYLSGIVSEILQQRGVSPSILRYPSRGINLYADLMTIVEWDCRTITYIAHLDARRQEKKPTAEFIVKVVERNGEDIRKRVDFYINLLEEVVLDVNYGEPW
jgi:hypothetical protein